MIVISQFKADNSQFKLDTSNFEQRNGPLTKATTH